MAKERSFAAVLSLASLKALARLMEEFGNDCPSDDPGKEGDGGREKGDFGII
jgi:hypothetical protein